MEELVFKTARELLMLIKMGDLSSREVLAAHLRQIERTNPEVNAIVELAVDRAAAQADDADRRFAGGDELGPLHGLPIAHKDLFDTAGIRTTRGSPIFADHVPTTDSPVVSTLRRAGAITIGKTNTSEFGIGSQTFNPVFGATRNPYWPLLTSGGSSGGAAAALACGMIPIADGTDLGGSLRNPAAFCNVVGLRPTPDAATRSEGPSWDRLDVVGPMARTVGDVALLLEVMTGGERPAAPRVPDGGGDGPSIAWSESLGGLPVEPAVIEVIRSSRETLEGLGCRLEEATPDLENADRVFRLLRARLLAATLGGYVREHPDLVKETVRWNVQIGERLGAHEIEEAVELQAGLVRRMEEFFLRFDALVCPVTQVAPFAVEVEYPEEIDGQRLSTYIDWMQSCYLISATGCPALSMPAGFTPEGMPVGIQIVAGPGKERTIVDLAERFEGATEYWRRAPALAV